VTQELSSRDDGSLRIIPPKHKIKPQKNKKNSLVEPGEKKILMFAHLSQNRPENVYKFGCYFQKGRLLLGRFTGMPC